MVLRPLKKDKLTFDLTFKIGIYTCISEKVRLRSKVCSFNYYGPGTCRRNYSKLLRIHYQRIHIHDFSKTSAKKDYVQYNYAFFASPPQKWVFSDVFKLTWSEGLSEPFLSPVVCRLYICPCLGVWNTLMRWSMNRAIVLL